MKFKIGDKILAHKSWGEAFIITIIEVINNEFYCGYKITRSDWDGTQLWCEYDSFVKKWKKLNHYDTKLGKVLYK